MNIFIGEPDYNISDLGFNRSLIKTSLDQGATFDIPPEMINVFAGGTAPKNLTTGELSGLLFDGKTSFTDTTAGYRMGADPTDGQFKLVIGTTGQQMDWNVTTANTLTITGALSVGSIDI